MQNEDDKVYDMFVGNANVVQAMRGEEEEGSEHEDAECRQFAKENGQGDALSSTSSFKDGSEASTIRSTYQ